MSCHNQLPLGITHVASQGEGSRVVLPPLLPRSPICCLNFHSLPVCGPFFLSPSKEPAFSCPVRRSQGQPSLGKPPPSQEGLLCACLPRPLAAPGWGHSSILHPTAAGIQPPVLGPASVSLWGLGGPSRPFFTFCGTSDASKTVSSPWLGRGAAELSAELISPNSP